MNHKNKTKQKYTKTKTVCQKKPNIGKLFANHNRVKVQTFPFYKMHMQIHTKMIQANVK